MQLFQIKLLPGQLSSNGLQNSVVVGRASEMSPCSGRPTSVITKDHVAAVKAMVEEVALVIMALHMVWSYHRGVSLPSSMGS